MWCVILFTTILVTSTIKELQVLRPLLVLLLGPQLASVLVPRAHVLQDGAGGSDRELATDA